MITTTEYGLASYLLSKGMPIQNTELNPAGEVVFHFEDNAQQEEQAFYQNSGLIEIQTYLAAQRRVKNLLYRLKRNKNGNKQKGFR